MARNFRWYARTDLASAGPSYIEPPLCGILETYHSPISITGEVIDMARVLGIHQLTLKEGVTAEEFEKHVKEETLPAWADVSGLKLSLFRGDRGNRDGQYLTLFEIDSVEDRDRIIPRDGESEVMKARREIIDKYFSFVSTDFTDYVELYTTDDLTD